MHNNTATDELGDWWLGWLAAAVVRCLRIWRRAVGLTSISVVLLLLGVHVGMIVAVLQLRLLYSLLPCCVSPCVSNRERACPDFARLPSPRLERSSTGALRAQKPLRQRKRGAVPRRMLPTGAAGDGAEKAERRAAGGVGCVSGDRDGVVGRVARQRRRMWRLNKARTTERSARVQTTIPPTADPPWRAASYGRRRGPSWLTSLVPSARRLRGALWPRRLGALATAIPPLRTTERAS